MVNLEIYNEAVVVVAQAHNPSILHPFFLKSQNIVPEDWEPVEPPICTPPFSIAKYPDGTVFTVEENKFQVLKAPPTTNIGESRVPEFAIKYIQTLPHVGYKAVGINFGSILEKTNPENYIIDRFIRSGPWNEAPLLLSALSLTFIYAVDGGTLNISIEPAQRSYLVTGEFQQGIMVKANYHFALPAQDPLAEAIKAIAEFPNRYKHFEEIMGRVFGAEDKK